MEFEIQFLYPQLLGNPQNNLEIKVCNCNKREMLLSSILFVYTLFLGCLFFRSKEQPFF